MGSHQVLYLQMSNLWDLGYGLDLVYTLSVYLNIQQSLYESFSHSLAQKNVFYVGILKIVLS